MAIVQNLYPEGYFGFFQLAYLFESPWVWNTFVILQMLFLPTVLVCEGKFNKKVILNEDINLFSKEPISEEEGRGDGFHWKDYVYDDIEIHALIGDDGIERCNRIITTSQNYKTPREIKVGDSLEELLKLYPEASKDPWNNIYIYHPEDEIGFNRIFFTLKNDVIIEIKLENGIDG